MTEREFAHLAKLHRLRGKSLNACRRVLVGGETAYTVAVAMGLNRSTISRALARLARPVCPQCGQPIG